MRSSIGTGLLLATVLLAVTAQPAGAADGKDEGKKQAAAIFMKGNQLFAAGDYVGALEAFEQTFTMYKHHVVLCNIARCQERLSNMIKAAQFYERCLAAGGKQDAQVATRVQAALKLVRGRIGHAQVNSKDPKGVVYVDGQEMGLVPRRVDLNPGRRIVEVRREGAKAARAEFFVRGGEVRKLELTPQDLRVTPVPSSAPVEKRARKPIRSLWFWVAVATTGILAATAVIFSVQAKSRESDFQELRTLDNRNRAETSQTLANVFWGLTAASGAGTAVLFFFTDFGGSKAERTALRRPTSLGIGLRGTF